MIIKKYQFSELKPPENYIHSKPYFTCYTMHVLYNFY